jgi:predicted aminopeptidase
MFGCAGYRGYFGMADAEAQAAELRAAGYDVEVGPVPAYSTLGWFPDPLLNTFIDWNDAELARLIFHELAHQIVYVGDDTVFNESFATTVERAGVRRWLVDAGTPAARAAWPQIERRRADFIALLLDYRRRLSDLYASPLPDADKRERKRVLLAALRQDHQDLRRDRWNGFAGYDRFFGADLNGARLAAVGAYNDLVPAFEGLLDGVGGDLPRFFDAVRDLARKPRNERDALLGRKAPAGP